MAFLTLRPHTISRIPVAEMSWNVWVCFINIRIRNNGNLKTYWLLSVCTSWTLMDKTSGYIKAIWTNHPIKRTDTWWMPTALVVLPGGWSGPKPPFKIGAYMKKGLSISRKSLVRFAGGPSVTWTPNQLIKRGKDYFLLTINWHQYRILFCPKIEQFQQIQQFFRKKLCYKMMKMAYGNPL